jgi:uncharacterized RDD family membrane protein YckC
MSAVAEPAEAGTPESAEGPESTEARTPESAEASTPVEAVSGEQPRYVGLATRVVAFVIDAALIDLVGVVVTAAVALIVSLFHFPHQLETILKWIGAGAFILWSAAYFVGFWSATGQTPGNRLMQIRVVTADGDRVKPRRGIVRCVGLVLAALPLFAGYALILFDRHRRGFQDRFAGTVVVEAPDLSLAQARRAKMWEAYDASRRPPTATPK